MVNDKGKTVLVVDDNDDVRRLVKKVLEMSGFNVNEAVDGEGALRSIGDQMPDLILMDIRLPGKLSGLDATCRIKEDSRMQRVPVVALTASVLERDRQQALAAGCNGFIAKPLDISALPKMVETFIDRGAIAPR